MREAVRAIIAVAAVLLVLAVAGALKPNDPDVPDGSTIAAAPSPPPVPAAAEEAAACPDLTNPGGLDWRATKDPGPHATGGSVSVPQLGVEAPIVRVGVAGSGKMVVPRNPRDVAWLDQGTYPGETQNAVLAGHVSYSGRPGVFADLQGLKSGSLVSVRLDGKRWDYRVVWNCLFDRRTELAERIMGRTEIPSVTLISCGGVYDRRAGTHTKRIAVRGELVRLVG